MADSLQAELLAIDGIAAAEIDGGGDAPHSVRVQLTAEANPKAVSVAIERVLTSHGMRSHLAGQSAAPAESPEGPPPPPGAEGTSADVVPMRSVQVGEGATYGVPMDGITVQPTVSMEPAPAAPVELDSVAVEESRQGVSVRVSAGGQTATRLVGSGPNAMDAAIVSAVGELVGVEPELVAGQRGEAGDSKIVTVLANVPAKGQVVGSAVVTAGEAFAVAQAAWRALKAPE